MYYVALDVGGTKTSCCIFTENGEILEDYVHVVPSVTSTGEDRVFFHSLQAVQDTLAYLSIAPTEVFAMGIGGPGPLDHKRGVILYAPMMGWHNFPLAPRMAEHFPFPVYLDNDGNLGALAEQRRGLAVGKADVGYMTVSTGIGGGLVLGGQLYHGYNSGAGEFGHMSIFPQGVLCPCGNYGCLEMYASGTAIGQRMKKDWEAGVESSLFTPESPHFTCGALAEAAKMGDSYACRIFQEEGTFLGLALSNILNLLDLEMVVLGGGVTKSAAFFQDSMYQVLEARCIQPFQREQIQFSQMNDRAVLYGCYFLAKETMDRNK